MGSSNGLRSGQLAGDGGLSCQYQPMAQDEARDLVRSCYGLDGSLTRLATEKDDTFRLDGEDRRGFVLKVANPAESTEEISFQVELLDHVASADQAIPVPQTVRDREGRRHPEIVDRAGQRRLVRLMTYLDGTPLDSTPSSAAERRKVGELLARLRLATAGFAHPGDSRVLAWDVQHLPLLRPLLDSIRDGRQRSQLTAGIHRFEALQPRVRRLRTQVLHNDFSKSNIIVDHDDPRFVTGIIDFGDAVRTAVAIDLATALLNQLPCDLAERPADDLFADGRDLLRGYLAVADLTAEELFLLPHLVMARVVARALITLRRASLFPENSAYILRNTDQGWAQLDWFVRRSVDEVSDALSAPAI